MDGRMRTQVIHDIRLAPLCRVGGGDRGGPDAAGVQQQVVDLARAQLGQRLLRERPHIAQVAQLERQQAQAVLAGVVGEPVERALQARRVPGAEDELVGLGLLQELLDGFKPLLG